jgi:putative membrane protein
VIVCWVIADLPLPAHVSRPSASAKSADMLAKLHAVNQRETAAGKLAQEKGESAEMKAYGKMLVVDHTEAERKLAALARRERVDLAITGAPDLPEIPPGPDFDGTLARQTMADQQQTIAEVTAARDQLDDPELRALLTDLLPVLQRHEQAAKRIVEGEAKK